MKQICYSKRRLCAPTNLLGLTFGKPTGLELNTWKWEIEMNDQRLSREDAAKYLGVSVRTLEGWAHSGTKKLPYYKPGRKAYYLQSDLDKFLIDNRKGV